MCEDGCILPHPQKGKGFKWVSYCWKMLLRDPKGWDFSIPWVEFNISKGAPWPWKDSCPPLPGQRVQSCHLHVWISQFCLQPHKEVALAGLAQGARTSLPKVSVVVIAG